MHNKIVIFKSIYNTFSNDQLVYLSKNTATKKTKTKDSILDLK